MIIRRHRYFYHALLPHLLIFGNNRGYDFYLLIKDVFLSASVKLLPLSARASKNASPALMEGSIHTKLKRSCRSRKSSTVKYLTESRTSSFLDEKPRFSQKFPIPGNGFNHVVPVRLKNHSRIKVLSASERSSAFLRLIFLYLSEALPEA